MDSFQIYVTESWVKKTELRWNKSDKNAIKVLPSRRCCQYCARTGQQDQRHKNVWEPNNSVWEKRRRCMYSVVIVDDATEYFSFMDRSFG